MIISFKDNELHDVCVALRKAEQAFGSVHAAALVTFLADAKAADTAAQLFDVLGPDVWTLDDQSICVAVGSDYLASLIIVGKKHRCDSDGQVIWKTVTRLKLVEIRKRLTC